MNDLAEFEMTRRKQSSARPVWVRQRAGQGKGSRSTLEVVDEATSTASTTEVEAVAGQPTSQRHEHPSPRWYKLQRRLICNDGTTAMLLQTAVQHMLTELLECCYCELIAVTPNDKSFTDPEAMQ